MIWEWSHRADQRARILADRHYSRQKPGTPQFGPPGRCCVLYAKTRTGEAYWVTSWPFAEYVKHAWRGAWVCSAFRNEHAGVASEMITQAIAASLAFWRNEPPGIVTFIDRAKVVPTIVRGARVWGWTYRKAGFHEAGETKGGLLALWLPRSQMPIAQPARMPIEVVV